MVCNVDVQMLTGCSAKKNKKNLENKWQYMYLHYNIMVHIKKERLFKQCVYYTLVIALAVEI